MKQPSWVKPIEQEILSFCNDMASQMRSVRLAGADKMALAYETVAKHIKDEIKIRKLIK